MIPAVHSFYRYISANWYMQIYINFLNFWSRRGIQLQITLKRNVLKHDLTWFLACIHLHIHVYRIVVKAFRNRIPLTLWAIANESTAPALIFFCTIHFTNIQCRRFIQMCWPGNLKFLDDIVTEVFALFPIIVMVEFGREYYNKIWLNWYWCGCGVFDYGQRLDLYRNIPIVSRFLWTQDSNSPSIIMSSWQR